MDNYASDFSPMSQFLTSSALASLPTSPIIGAASSPLLTASGLNAMPTYSPTIGESTSMNEIGAKDLRSTATLTEANTTLGQLSRPPLNPGFPPAQQSVQPNLLHPYHYHLTFTSTDVAFVAQVCQVLTLTIAEITVLQQNTHALAKASTTSTPPGVLCGLACCLFYSREKPDRQRVAKEMGSVPKMTHKVSMTASSVAAAGLAASSLPPLPGKTVKGSSSNIMPTPTLSATLPIPSPSIPLPVKRERTNSFGLDAIAAASFILDSPSAGAASQKAADGVEGFILGGGSMLDGSAGGQAVASNSTSINPPNPTQAALPPATLAISDSSPLLSAEQNTLLRTPLGFHGQNPTMNAAGEAINIATDPWATCLSSQAYASLSSSESNKDCWERLGVAGFLRDYKQFCKEREKEKKVDNMATNQSVVEFLWEGRVVVRPPRCGEKGWEVDGVEVEGLNGGTVEGMDKEFDGIIWRAVEIVRMIDGAKTCSKEECLIAAGWRAIEAKVTKTPNDTRNDAGSSGDSAKAKAEDTTSTKKTEPEAAATAAAPTPSRTSNRRNKSPKRQKQKEVKEEKVVKEEEKEDTSKDESPTSTTSDKPPTAPTTTMYLPPYLPHTPLPHPPTPLSVNDAYLTHLKSLSDSALQLSCDVRRVAVLGSRWKVVRSYGDDSSDDGHANAYLKKFAPKKSRPSSSINLKRKTIDVASKHNSKGHQDPRPVTKGECNWCAPVSAPSSEANHPICPSCKICQRLGWERRAKYRYKKGLANRGFFDVNYYDELGKHRGRSVKMFLQLTQSYVRYVLKNGGVDEHVTRMEREDKGATLQQKKKRRRSDQDMSRADEFV